MTDDIAKLSRSKDNEIKVLEDQLKAAHKLTEDTTEKCNRGMDEMRAQLVQQSKQSDADIKALKQQMADMKA